MAYNKRYNLAFRRQREGRTNYKSRLSLLKSNMPRLVVRRTNRHFIVQAATYGEKGDLVLLTVTSRDLKKFGWTAGTLNLPSAYLTGLLAGKKLAKKGINNAIADVGLQTVTHKGNIYACLKGIVDSGISMPVNEEYFPDASRIEGKHIQQYTMKSPKGTQFSKTKEASSSMPSLFSKTKTAIQGMN